MATRRLVKRTRKQIPEYTVLGCPRTKSHSLWCHALCAPKDGIGECGRVAPHALMGRSAEAILKFKIEKAREEAQLA